MTGDSEESNFRKPPKTERDAAGRKPSTHIRYSEMKRLFRILAGALAMVVCLSLIRPALAQEDAAKDSAAHKKHPMHYMDHMEHMGMEHRLERMTEHLDLTDEQAASIEAILDEHKQSMEELAERHQALHDELINSLSEALTEEQMETMEGHMDGSKSKRGKAMKGKRDGDRERGKRMRGKRGKGQRR